MRRDEWRRREHWRRHGHDRGGNTEWIALGAAALIGAAGAAYYLQQQPQRHQAHRPPDSAPGRTARQRTFGRYAVVSRTVTIDRPRTQLYGFWRDFQNLPQFMENVKAVTPLDGEVTRWTIEGPMGRDVQVETRIVEDRPNELIAWRSVEGSDIDTEGRVRFRDAPGGRGTEVEAVVAYDAPGGEIGRWIATIFQKEPAIQGRRELKRLKMLMETGEIATSRNHHSARRGGQ
ncbi:SRPBCC family protein [Lutibaculum baratangense]|uniref:Coenzyme Q-binding protein COQ10 START domain-containing protein n=1 Tax=Lutibaculum baratangense AMV1 TaxID=631454 RepID=V4T7L4_9HYPH|nr:SRPBCC family protein [Lutibaculum baratangense]ESR22608.1 hypothetical protein N177_3744 [Lutibaculum baratangense AMV1]